jgi:hypothetical protein
MSKRELFRAEQLPVFQNKAFPTSAAAMQCERGDVVLVEDDSSGLIYNDAFDPAKLVYDGNYQNEQAHSGVFQEHLENVSDIVSRHFFGQSLIEVGCGKGYFLEHLQRTGYHVTGIDPAYDGTNPSVIKARFEPGLGLSAEGIVLRHVLEHIQDPLKFLANIREANGGKGTVYIEVPCFDWICRHRAWFDIFYEHVNYFRRDNFLQIFGTIHEAGHVFGGQYLYAIAELASLRRPSMHQDSGVNFPVDFLGDIKHFTALPKAGKRRAIWGGASKGVIFALYMRRAGVDIDMVIDINPAKQGRYLPATGLRVASPAEALQSLKPGDDVFVMNPNYLEEIVVQSGNRFNYLTVDYHEF